jgi:hypothetical protein
MGFTKLDEGIVFSSIMAEDDSVFKVFSIFLATCKSNGVSPVSPIFISSITKKPIEEVMRCVKILESPDPLSRSTTDEGRRIRKVDGGYFLINYLKYRDFTYSDNPEAIKKRKQRERGDISGHVPLCPNVSGTFRDISGHSASASVSGIKEGMQGGNDNKNTAFNINGFDIPYSFYVSVLKKCNNDVEQAGRVFFRAKCQSTKNPIAWISAGLVKNKDGEYYALKSIAQEDTDSIGMRKWIDTVVNHYKDE